VNTVALEFNGVKAFADIFFDIEARNDYGGLLVGVHIIEGYALFKEQ
jgi:hypothetical protein